MKVLLVVNDLFFEAKIGEVLRSLGVPSGTAKSEEGLGKRLAEFRPALAFVDLGAKGIDPGRAIAALRGAPGLEGLPIVAFMSHVRPEDGALARTLGASEVYPKSELARRLPDIVKKHVRVEERGGGAS